MTWDLETTDGTVRVGRMHGDGDAVVLFVPGRGDSLELREPVARRIARRARVVVMVELRGQGGSGRLGHHPDAVHIDTFEQHVDDVSTVLETLPARGVHLVAHSMGGLLAAHLLAREPGRFATAAISSPMWRFTQPLPVARALATAARIAGRGRHFAAGERPFDLPACREMRTGRPAPTDDGTLEAFAATHPSLLRGGSTWGWVAAAARSMADLDRAPLERCPTDVVIGSCRADRTVSLAAHHRIAARFPNARVVDLPGGHDPFVSEGAVGWWTVVESMWPAA